MRKSFATLHTPHRRASIRWRALVFAGVLMGCYTSTEDALQRLKSDQSLVRRNAADSIRHNGATHDTVGPLLAAANKETDAPALGAELLALGASGAPEAEPLICANVKSTDRDVKRWAGKAFLLWFPQNPQRVACAPVAMSIAVPVATARIAAPATATPAASSEPAAASSAATDASVQ